MPAATAAFNDSTSDVGISPSSGILERRTDTRPSLPITTAHGFERSVLVRTRLPVAWPRTTPTLWSATAVDHQRGVQSGDEGHAEH